MNRNEALGLPPNSIRAILSVSLVSAVIYLAAVRGDATAITAVITLAGVVITNYFNKQKPSNGDTPKSIEVTTDKPILKKGG